MRPLITLIGIGIGFMSLIAAEPSDPVFRTILRKQGDDGVHTYRIPGLATTTKGTLIAVFDVRHDHAGDLPANIDIGMMRSTDDGQTWERMRHILDYDKSEMNTRGNGVGDPSILVDEKSGHILVVGLWSKGNRGWNGSGPGLTPDETGQIVLTRSTDDGLTWSKPVNITAQTKDPKWRLFFQGPGRGIQLADGTLVFPAQYRAADGTPHSCFISSNDGGVTWKTSPAAIPASPPTSEAQIAQLADGSLLLSMRDESRKGQRIWSRYDWKGNLSEGQWSEPWFTVPDPTCMASLIRHPKGPLLFSNPHSSKRRVAMTVRASDDNGKSWTTGRLIDARPSSYSCMTILRDGRVGILYETGDKTGIETLTFARFPLDWAQGRDPQ